MNDDNGASPERDEDPPSDYDISMMAMAQFEHLPIDPEIRARVWAEVRRIDETILRPPHHHGGGRARIKLVRPPEPPSIA